MISSDGKPTLTMDDVHPNDQTTSEQHEWQTLATLNTFIEAQEKLLPGINEEDRRCMEAELQAFKESVIMRQSRMLNEIERRNAHDYSTAINILILFKTSL